MKPKTNHFINRMYLMVQTKNIQAAFFVINNDVKAYWLDYIPQS